MNNNLSGIVITSTIIPLMVSFFMLVSLVITESLSASEVSVQHDLDYSVIVDFGISISGTMNQEFKPSTEGKWLFSRVAKAAFGFQATETSVISFLSINQLRSHLYSKVESGIGSDYRLSFAINELATYDVMSVSLQVALDLDNGIDIENKVYRVQTGEDKFDEYRFIIIGNELISTKLASVDTLVVEKIEEQGKRSVFWLMPDHHYLIAKATSNNNDGNDVTFALRHGWIDGEEIRLRD